MIRIVAGKHRGRAIATPEGSATRPTANRAREGLFNILMHANWTNDGASALIGARVLDAFAGSGALGIEALSRGAAHATFLDSDPAAIRLIGANLRKLGETASARVIRADATRPPPAPATGGREACDLVFLDPPYRSGLAAAALAALAEAGWLAPGAIATVELAGTEDLATPPEFQAVDERRYGAAKILILRYRR